MDSELLARLKRRLQNHRAHDEQRALPGIAAAVLVPMFQHEGQLYLFYTQRAAHLPTHRGQVAFPGGRAAPQDPDLLATALREAHEEVGLHPATVEVLGRLSTIHTNAGDYRVTPFVGLIPVPTGLAPDPREVAAVFSVPFAALRDPRFRGQYQWLNNGVSSSHPAVFYGEQTIWGLTLRITEELLDLFEAGNGDGAVRTQAAGRHSR